MTRIHIFSPSLFCACERNVHSDRCVSAFAFQDLPLLSDVPTAERDPLFIRKLRLCAFVFEFEAEPKAPPSGDGAAGLSAQAPPPPPRVDPFTAEKEVKRQALLELVDYLNKTKAAFSEPALAEMFDMVSMNLFRPLRPASAELGVWDPEEDEPVLLRVLWISCIHLGIDSWP